MLHIYYDCNKTRETCVHIGYFIHSGVFMCFYKLFTGTRISKDFQFRVSGSGNNRKHTALLCTLYIFKLKIFVTM